MQVRLAVVHVDVKGIEAGRTTTSAETFRPVWMDIGGPSPSEAAATNGEAIAYRPPSEPDARRPGGGRNGGSQGVRGGGEGGVDIGAGAAAATAGIVGNDSSSGEEIYLARVNWLQDGSLCAQVQNRAQTELRLLRLDPATGTPTTLVVEKSKVWINLHHLLRSLPAPAQQVCTSGLEEGLTGAGRRKDVCACAFLYHCVALACGLLRGVHERRLRAGGGQGKGKGKMYGQTQRQFQVGVVVQSTAVISTYSQRARRKRNIESATATFWQ